ncbi:MAG: acyltransferase [Algoriphagus aquaeductus]|uniref:acyltransferase n=1 Tax=Algoriphagus aquaeductus TaxID=475299 RepID=UPI0038798B30
MILNNKEVSIGLFLGKILKVLGIRIGFIWPTLKSKFILRIYKCNYGKNLKVSGRVFFRPALNNAISFGDNVTLTSRFLTNTVGISNPMIFETLENGLIEIGNNSGLTSTIISSRSKVTIGDYVKIGANVRIFDHDFHSLDFLQRRNHFSDFPNAKTNEILIEDDVFIGTNCIILKGVHIGKGSIVGAGSVVAIKDIPPYSKVFGNPARIVGKVKSDLSEN